MMIQQPMMAQNVRFGVHKPAHGTVEIHGIDRSASIDKTLGGTPKRSSVKVIQTKKDFDKLMQASVFQGQKPQVDFKKQAVVLTLLAEGKEVAGLDYTNAAQLQVKIRAQNPMPVTAVMNYPWHLAVVDKSMVQNPPQIREVPTYFP